LELIGYPIAKARWMDWGAESR